MKQTLTKLCIEKSTGTSAGNDRQFIRAVLSDERQYQVMIKPPFQDIQIAEALSKLSHMIKERIGLASNPEINKLFCGWNPALNAPVALDTTRRRGESDCKNKAVVRFEKVPFRKIKIFGPMQVWVSNPGLNLCESCEKMPGLIQFMSGLCEDGSARWERLRLDQL